MCVRVLFIIVFLIKKLIFRMKCQTSQEYFKATELLMDREKPWSNETTMKNDNK